MQRGLALQFHHWLATFFPRFLGITRNNYAAIRPLINRVTIIITRKTFEMDCVEIRHDLFKILLSFEYPRSRVRNYFTVIPLTDCEKPKTIRLTVKPFDSKINGNGIRRDLPPNYMRMSRYGRQCNVNDRTCPCKTHTRTFCNAREVKYRCTTVAAQWREV